MPYATTQDMIARFGAVEMTRLTTPAGQDMDGIVAEVADTALVSASAMIDSYVGRRYQVPMDVPPPIVVDVCCDLARFRLSTGDQKTTGEEVRMRQKDAMAWLVDVSLGKVVLELDEVEPGGESYSMATDRGQPVFGGRWP